MSVVVWCRIITCLFQNDYEYLQDVAKKLGEAEDDDSEKKHTTLW